MTGRGVFIQLSYFPPVKNAPIIFHFDSCTFENNTAHTVHYNHIYNDATELVHDGGGGVNLILGPGLNNVSIHFTGCKFLGNQAFHGSGLAIKIVGEMGRKTESVKVEILDSTFQHNGRNDVSFGGGVYVTLYDNNNYSSDHTYSIVGCHCIMKNTSFEGNLAEHGGGVYFFSIKQPDSNSLVFSNCSFKRNMAHIGSAVLLSPLNSLFDCQLMIPVFQDCQFVENKVNNSQFQSFYGVGTMYVSEYVIRFSGFNVFKNNLGSGIHVVNGIVNFQSSSATFINNTSLHGGALALVGSSTMIVGPNDYEFINNSATYQGGALYVMLLDKVEFTTPRACFLQYIGHEMNKSSSKWRSNIIFVGNKAEVTTGGHAIYSTSFYPCQIINSEFVDISQSFSSQDMDITFDNNSTLQPQLVTDVATLSITNKIETLTMIPGKIYYHQVTLSDDLNNTVNTSFRVAIEQTLRTGEIYLASHNIGSGIKLSGRPGAKAAIILETVSPREVYIRLNVELTECPPGYTLNISLECVCDADAYIGLFKCHDYQSYLLPGYWAGIINTTVGPKFVTSACRFYAEYDNSQPQNSLFEIVLPDSFSEPEISKIVCGETRTGVGCGMCRDKHTAYFHSPNFVCRLHEPFDCNLGWLFYFLSELLPITLIFITVLLLNIRFTSGAVNGFILFSQLLFSMDINASGVIVYPTYAKRKIQYATELYQLIYGFLNLDVFNSEYLSFCLMKSATALDILAFKYITVLYTILLIMAVILIMNKCRGRYVGKCCKITDIKISVTHGISTFLILCYSQCIEVSIGLLIPLHIYKPADDSNFTCNTCTRVWFNGELIYFHRNHLLYALPALFCLLTVGLFPPVLLLTYPLLNKLLFILGLDDHKVINSVSQKLPISSLKPLFDSFQSCFKDNLRFFAGLYFLYRWTLLFVYFVKDFSQYYTTVGTILLLMLTLHTIFQPYTKMTHNLVDALLFADLLLINSLSSYNFQKINSQKAQYGATVTPAIVQLVLIYIPLVVMLTYILRRSIMKLQKTSPRVKKVTNNIIIIVPERMLKLRKVVRSDDTDSNEEELIHNRLGVEYSEYYN